MKVVLTIAGSDSSGGAGIQADIKTAEAFGCFSATALTVITAQNTLGVREAMPLGASLVRSQIEAVMEDFSVEAIKIGMLYDTETIRGIGEFLIQNALKIPVVLDPVAISQAGSKLLLDEAIRSLADLFPLATVVTPNLKETELFWNLDQEPTLEILRERGVEFARERGVAFVVKNLRKEDRSVDYLIQEEGITSFCTPYVKNGQSHGTGCSFSMAIACLLALGLSLPEAVKEAKDYIYKAMLEAPFLGRGAGPILHRVKRS